MIQENNTFRRIKIIALNDIHGCLTDKDTDYMYRLELGYREVPVDELSDIPTGGLRLLSEGITLERLSCDDLIMVSAGDNIGAHPPWYGSFCQIRYGLPDTSNLMDSIVKALNTVPISVSAVGNHELDRGLQFFLNQTASLHFPYLAANLIHERTKLHPFTPWWIYEHSGIKIGFIGIITEDLATIAPIQKDNLVVTDSRQAIIQSVGELTDQGVKSIVVLLHEGENRKGTNNVTDFHGVSLYRSPVALSSIVSGLPAGINIIVSGHTHEAYDFHLENIAHEPVIISQNTPYVSMYTCFSFFYDISAGAIIPESIIASRTPFN